MPTLGAQFWSGGCATFRSCPATRLLFVLKVAEDMYLVHSLDEGYGFAGLVQCLLQLSFSGGAPKLSQVIKHTAHSVCCLAQRLNAKISYSGD